MNTLNDPAIMTQTYHTVNTVYIEYKSVVTHSQSHSHISGLTFFSSVIGTLSTASTPIFNA